MYADTAADAGDISEIGDSNRLRLTAEQIDIWQKCYAKLHDFVTNRMSYLKDTVRQKILDLFRKYQVSSVPSTSGATLLIAVHSIVKEYVRMVEGVKEMADKANVDFNVTAHQSLSIHVSDIMERNMAKVYAKMAEHHAQTQSVSWDNVQYRCGELLEVGLPELRAVVRCLKMAKEVEDGTASRQTVQRLRSAGPWKNRMYKALNVLALAMDGSNVELRFPTDATECAATTLFFMNEDVLGQLREILQLSNSFSLRLRLERMCSFIVRNMFRLRVTDEQVKQFADFVALVSRETAMCSTTERHVVGHAMNKIVRELQQSE